MRHDTTKVTFDPWLLEDVDWISEDANCLLSRGAWHTTPPGLNHLLQCAQRPSRLQVVAVHLVRCLAQMMAKDLVRWGSFGVFGNLAP